MLTLAHFERYQHAKTFGGRGATRNIPHKSFSAEHDRYHRHTTHCNTTNIFLKRRVIIIIHMDSSHLIHIIITNVTVAYSICWKYVL